MQPALIQSTLQNALTHHRAGRLAEAEILYRQVLAVEPRNFDALHMMGALALQLERADLGVEFLSRALAIHSTSAEVFSNLGSALRAIGRHEESISAHRRAVELQPESARAHYNLANALECSGRLADAIESYRQAVALEPTFAEAWNNLGLTLRASHCCDDAVTAFRRAIELRSEYADVHNSLGSSFHSNLAGCFKDMGQLDAAINLYRKAMAKDPRDKVAHSNLVYAVHFHSEYDAADLLREAVEWNRQHAKPLKPEILPGGNEPDPDRRLKIGYVSPYFCRHVVGQNLLPLFREHDHTRFEIFCYSDNLISDALTNEFRARADHWRNIVEGSDERVAELIRNDRIDVLIDLTQHMAHNRLLVFARKPAPVQAAYLGYCSTTGLEAMDYRLSDPHFDPPETDLSCYTEKTVRLRKSYWSYEPLGDTPEISPLPAQKAGYVTFGCLNNLAKVTEKTSSLWSRLLRALPSAHLLLLAPEGSCREALARRFASEGVSLDRVEFVSFQPWERYIDTIQRFDLALDPTPYGGGITTCDALWMGVPVVTLSGQTSVGRGGRSILCNIGLPELVAETPDEYVEIALSLACDLSRLSQLRSSLRSRMENSPLRDAKGRANDLENAFRQMWQKRRHGTAPG